MSTRAERPCEAPGCDRTTLARLCRSHQAQLRRRGSPTLLTPLRATNREGTPCRCGRHGVLNSPWGWLCVAHHARWKNHGAPDWETPVRAQRSKGSGKARRAIFLANRYRITEEWFATVLSEQADACALCQSPDPRGKGVFSVDHDHTCRHERFATGTRIHGCPDCIRGLLCDDCNQNVLPAIERAERSGLVLPTVLLRSYLAARPFQRFIP